MKRSTLIGLVAVALLGAFGLWALLRPSSGPASADDDHGHAATESASGDHSDAENEDAQGPHGGRLLTRGAIALELAIVEDGMPPEYRAWLTKDGKPVDSGASTLSVTLRRLGGVTDTIGFVPAGDFLRGTAEVDEPHSFDVTARAVVDGQAYTFAFSTYEGRTVLPEASRPNVVIETVGEGTLTVETPLTGEIVINADRVARLVPRLGGIVTAVRKNLGDYVRPGETVAVIESRELADLRANLLTAQERERLARINAQREAALFARGVSPEMDKIAAESALAEAVVARRNAEAALSALGVSGTGSLTRIDVRAAQGGVVTEKTVSVGETVMAGQPLFTVADLSTVWVEATVFPKDLARVQVGQRARVLLADADSLSTTGQVSYVGPLAGEDSRASRARIVIPNRNGRWKPGLFVTIDLTTETARALVVIPEAALQTFRDRDVVFVAVGDTFEARPVMLGRRSAGRVEVLDGLTPGSRIVSSGSYLIKADIEKAGASHDH